MRCPTSERAIDGPAQSEMGSQAALAIVFSARSNLPPRPSFSGLRHGQRCLVG
jgi:hypothetical protein